VHAFCLAIIALSAYFFSGHTDKGMTYVDISALATLWPILAVQARRWHDRNKSAIWLLMNFVPVIGFFWVVIENGFMPAIDEENEY